MYRLSSLFTDGLSFISVLMWLDLMILSLRKSGFHLLWKKCNLSYVHESLFMYHKQLVTLSLLSLSWSATLDDVKHLQNKSKKIKRLQQQQIDKKNVILLWMVKRPSIARYKRLTSKEYLHVWTNLTFVLKKYLHIWCEILGVFKGRKVERP